MNDITDNKSESFGELLRASMKSKDTEEWLDVHFTRPIGLAFALLWRRLGVHPNAITLLSIVLGACAGWMFYYTDLPHNIAGVALLMLANFCDSTDGQLARLTGQKTLAGRILDGFAGDVWFFAIYLALCLRLMPQNMPGTTFLWGWWIFALAFVAGVLCHSPQSSLADYYRQIHLFFLNGRQGAELDSYAKMHATYLSLPRKGAFWARAFYFNYQHYCNSQEKRTPAFQRLREAAGRRYGGLDKLPADLKNEFLAGSRPLMPLTNILTFNTRAICLYVFCLLNIPWAYFLVDIIVMSMICIYMHHRHEKLCLGLTRKILSANEDKGTHL